MLVVKKDVYASKLTHVRSPDELVSSGGTYPQRADLTLHPLKRGLALLQEPWLGDHDASLPKIHIGICAMDKKAHSRPMSAIVDRLETYGEFEVTYFGDDTIMNKPIAEWPACDCLLSWHSDGFPLAKVRFSVLLYQSHLTPRGPMTSPCDHFCITGTDRCCTSTPV